MLASSLVDPDRAGLVVHATPNIANATPVATASAIAVAPSIEASMLVDANNATPSIDFERADVVVPGLAAEVVVAVVPTCEV